MPKHGEGKEELKITQYERRFGDDRRSSRCRLLRPWFDFGRDIGGFCYVHRSEISLSLSSPHKGEAKVRFGRINLTNRTAAKSILGGGDERKKEDDK